jgi:hypothetical protein
MCRFACLQKCALAFCKPHIEERFSEFFSDCSHKLRVFHEIPHGPFSPIDSPLRTSSSPVLLNIIREEKHTLKKCKIDLQHQISPKSVSHFGDEIFVDRLTHDFKLRFNKTICVNDILIFN